MARPAYGYRNAAGKKVPGSTTVLKNVSTMDTDILCNWAARLAREGKDWRAARRTAGEHGSFLHDLCEKRLPHPLDLAADKPPEVSVVQGPKGEPSAWDKLQLSYAAVLEWYVKYGPRVVFAEQPLVSEAFQFGGTPDAVVVFPADIADYAIIGGEPWLLDYKTGRMIGAKEVAQMAAYRQLLMEKELYSVRGAILIHAPTVQAGYMRPVVLNSDTLDLGWDVFLAALKVGERLPKLEEVCG